jgi:hypothetical protein
VFLKAQITRLLPSNDVPYWLHHCQIILFFKVKVAIATRILDAGTIGNYMHNLHIAICLCFKFHEKIYEELLKLSQDPEKCDRQTDGRTERKP